MGTEKSKTKDESARRVPVEALVMQPPFAIKLNSNEFAAYPDMNFEPTKYLQDAERFYDKEEAECELKELKALYYYERNYENAEIIEWRVFTKKDMINFAYFCRGFLDGTINENSIEEWLENVAAG